MTPPGSMDSPSSENPTMTQEERSHLQRRALWNAVGGAIFIGIWIVVAIAILSARNSPSAAPPIILFGILLLFAVGVGFRAYPRLQRAYAIWQDMRDGQVAFDVGTVAPQVFSAGRSVQMLLVVDGDRTYFTLDSVLISIHSAPQEIQMNGCYRLRIAPRSRIVVNAVHV